MSTSPTSTPSLSSSPTASLSSPSSAKPSNVARRLGLRRVARAGILSGVGLVLTFTLGLGLYLGLSLGIPNSAPTALVPVVSAAEPQDQPVPGEPPLLRIQVQGNGLVQAEPDIAYVWIGVQTRAKAASEAQQQNAQLATKLLSVLEKYASKDKIKTSEFGLYQQQEWDDATRTNRPGDFVVTHVFSVPVTDLAKVAAVLDEGIAAGANIVRNIQFTLQDQAKATDSALQKAVADAQRKAQVIAAASGYEIVGLLTVGEGSLGMPEPLSPTRATKFALDSGSAATPVAPGQVEVNASVQVTFLARPVAPSQSN